MNGADRQRQLFGSREHLDRFDEIETAPGGADHPDVCDAGNGREAGDRVLGDRLRTAVGNRGLQPFNAPGSGGACLGASFVSVGRLAVSQSTIPPFNAEAR